MQISTLIAAAGLAEAAWMLIMMAMSGGLLMICVIALFALILRSKKTAIAALVMLGLFTVFFQPWYCFSPVDATAYDDPDVVSAVGEFRVIGIAWILTTLFALVAFLVAWINNRVVTSEDLSTTTK